MAAERIAAAGGAAAAGSGKQQKGEGALAAPSGPDFGRRVSLRGRVLKRLQEKLMASLFRVRGDGDGPHHGRGSSGGGDAGGSRRGGRRRGGRQQ